VARIIYHLLTSRQSYNDSVFAKAEQKHRQRLQNRLKTQAQALDSHSFRSKLKGRFLGSRARLRFTNRLQYRLGDAG
jgi:hypothetical protein